MFFFFFLNFFSFLIFFIIQISYLIINPRWKRYLVHCFLGDLWTLQDQASEVDVHMEDANGVIRAIKVGVNCP